MISQGKSIIVKLFEEKNQKIILLSHVRKDFLRFPNIQTIKENTNSFNQY